MKFQAAIVFLCCAMLSTALRVAQEKPKKISKHVETKNPRKFSLPTNPLKYPPSLTVLSVTKPSNDRLTIELELNIEERVSIWANPIGLESMEFAALQLVLEDEQAQPVTSKTSYPKGIPVANYSIDSVYVYRDKVRLTMHSDAILLPKKLLVRAKMWGMTKNACLGPAELRIEVPQPKN